MKNILTKKSVSDYLILAAGLLYLVSLIVYLCTGKTAFNEHYNVACIVSSIILVVVCLASFIILPQKVFRYFSFAFGFYALIEYVLSQINYLANIFTAIDPTPVTAGLILPFVFYIIALGTSLASGILSKVDFDMFFHKNKEEKR